jgi:3-hydroxyacyl-[acyl-carrier-protein] dehydratase
MKSYFSIPGDHPMFKGHFPQQPVVPAVMLLAKVEDAMQAHWPEVKVSSVKRMKFVHIVQPGQRIEIDITEKDIPLDGSPVDISASLKQAETLVAKGVLSVVRTGA